MDFFQTISQLFTKIWLCQGKYRAYFVVGCVLIILTMFVNLSIPLVLKFTIDKLSLYSNYSEKIIPFSIVIFLFYYGVMYTLAHVLSILREIIFNQTIEDTIKNCYLSVFEHIMNLDLQFHLTKKTGAITNTLQRLQTAIPEAFRAIMLYIIPTSIEILIAVGIIGILFGWEFGISLFIILITYLGFTVSTSKWTGNRQKEFEIERSKLNAQTIESLLNYETARYCNNIQLEIDKCEKSLEVAKQKALSFKTRGLLIHIGQGIIIGMGLCLLTLWSGNKVLSGHLQISDFIAINAYLLQFAVPLGHFGWMIRELNQAVIQIRNGFNLFNHIPKVIDKKTAKPFAPTSTDIVFKDVSFAYDVDTIILDKLNFKIDPGQTIAIVGSSGAGKSTIAKLLFRLYDVTSGAILINNQDIRDISQISLQQIIGVIPQDIVLFNATLLENIQYGNQQATMEEIENVIEEVQLTSMIKKAPKGYNTIVGERGLKISGGEKQRLALARMLLKKPQIFLFDEATSSLDSKTEKEILQNIKYQTQNMTTIIIAHRLSTITHADKILFLKDKQICESGTHVELLDKRGEYATLWGKQMKDQ